MSAIRQIAPNLLNISIVAMKYFDEPTDRGRLDGSVDDSVLQDSVQGELGSD